MPKREIDMDYLSISNVISTLKRARRNDSTLIETQKDGIAKTAIRIYNKLKERA